MHSAAAAVNAASRRGRRAMTVHRAGVLPGPGQAPLMCSVSATRRQRLTLFERQPASDPGPGSASRAATSAIARAIRGPYQEISVPSMQWIRPVAAAGVRDRGELRDVARAERVRLVRQQDHLGARGGDLAHRRRSDSGARCAIAETRCGRRTARADRPRRCRRRPPSRAASRSDRRRACAARAPRRGRVRPRFRARGSAARARSAGAPSWASSRTSATPSATVRG